MIVSADDRVDSHGDVIHDHGQVVSGAAIASADDEIVEFGVLENDIALDDIRQYGGAVFGRFEPDHGMVSFFQVFMPTGAVVFGLSAFGLGFFPHGLDGFGRASAVIGISAVN